MPGSTALHMTSEEWYAARHTSLGARANTVVVIMSVMMVGAGIGVLFLPLPTDVSVIMAMGLCVFYIVWLFWYVWMRRGRKVPLNYYKQRRNITFRSPYRKQKRKSNIRPRRNTPAKRRK
jgi:Ca2+/Na+ antiporter